MSDNDSHLISYKLASWATTPHLKPTTPHMSGLVWLDSHIVATAHICHPRHPPTHSVGVLFSNYFSPENVILIAFLINEISQFVYEM